MKAKMMRTILLLVFAMLITTIWNPIYASAEDLPSNFQNFISDARWKSGISWSASQSPKLSSFSSSACCAYCADFTKYCYGIDNPRGGTAFDDTSEIRAGDVLTIGNQSDGTGHWFVCLKRSGNSLYVAEGNYGGMVRIGWNYSISATHYFNEDSRYFTAGYHFSYDLPDSNQVLPDGGYIIAAAADTHYYLDIAGNAYPAATGTNVRLNYSSSGMVEDYDAWSLEFIDGYYRISQYNQTVCLDVEDESAANGQNVQVWPSNGTSAQQWVITGSQSTGYRICARCSAKYLEYENSNLSSGTNVQQWAYADVSAQKWMIIPYKQSYTVSYNGNASGVSGVPGQQTKTAGKALTLSTVQPSRASSTAGSYTVTLNANGGKVDTASLTAGRTTNYTFKNWNTARNGSGTSYSPGGSYTTDANVTLYAQWNSSTTTAAVTLPTPYYYGYYFKGWATSSSASSGVTGSYTPSGNCTLYATWEKEDLSGWSDEKPDNIYDDLIETATEYRYADRTVTFSWTQTDSGTIDYVESWPSGFDQSHSLYSQYHNTPKTVGISGNKKVEASTVANGFIYWHWCRNILTDGPYNRYINDQYSDEFNTFHAFYSTTDAGHSDGNVSPDDCYYFPNAGVCTESYWWFRLPVYRQTYKEYTGETDYSYWSDWSCWTMIVYPTGETRKSESKTVYRYKDNIAVILTFNANGGTCSTSEKTVIPGERYGTMPTPTRTGYSFDGWYTASEGGSRVTQTTRITTRSDHSLYAHWTKTDITVTFDPNGGSVSPSSKTVTYGSTYGTLPTPTREGYSFDGWFTASEGGSKVTSSTTVTTASDHTLYAHWTANVYTVTFNAVASPTSTTSKTVYYGSPYGDMPTPTRMGYTFDGWFTAESGGSLVTSSTIVTTASDHTLYSHWSGPNTYTVTFDANGGNVSPTSKTVTYYSTYGDLPTPTRTGYSFDGWFTAIYGGAQVTSATRVTNASDHTLHAHWTTVDITVTFDPNGGSVSTTSKTVYYGSMYGALPTPTRTGYIFNGWYTAASGGSQVTASTTVTTASDHTLYAHWTTVDITVTFDPNGGSVSPTSKTVTYGSTYGTLPTPTREGYSFDGWFTASEGGSQVTSSTTVTTASNHTLYAHWTAMEYTVYFDPNGGNISTISKKVTYGEAYGTLPTPTRTEYTFIGWYTAAIDGTPVTSSTTVTTASDHTLYAHWTEEEEPAFDGTIVWNSADVQYKGSTPYVIANGSAQTPRFSVKDRNGNTVSRSNYTYVYRENTNAGTGYVIVTFTSQYSGTARAWFKIYLPPTTATTVENVSDGIRITWNPVEGAVGYVIYRRAWSTTTNGWTTFERWFNVTGLEWIDGSDVNHKVYAGTRYQYGVKAYFARRVDPVSGATIGGNVGDNYNLGEVGPLKTTVRITTRVLNSVTAGRKQLTAKWGASSVFTGYQVQCATNSAFTKDVRTIRITDPKTAQTVINNLTSGRVYYVRVRSYHEFEGMTYFGEWSNVKNCRVQ